VKHHNQFYFIVCSEKVIALQTRHRSYSHFH
jgi:hypothetical protein